MGTGSSRLTSLSELKAQVSRSLGMDLMVRWGLIVQSGVGYVVRYISTTLGFGLGVTFTRPGSQGVV